MQMPETKSLAQQIAIGTRFGSPICERSYDYTDFLIRSSGRIWSTGYLHSGLAVPTLIPFLLRFIPFLL